MLKTSAPKADSAWLSAVDKAVIAALAYYDVFYYPLTAEEIYHNANDLCESKETVQDALKALCEAEMVFEKDGYFQLVDAPDRIERRIIGNGKAKALMPKAYRKSKFIGSFPFVRGVFLSGSMSKGFIGEDSDIDYFIVTKPGRLWFARTMLILYKKVFLLNSYKFFCLNYFVDTEHLTIEEKNRFTATELVTVIPTYGPEMYAAFRAENQWALDHYPNFPYRELEKVHPMRVRGLKKMLEWMFNNRFGDAIDKWCMRRTLKHWKKKFDHFDADAFEVAMKSRSYVSKHHPSHFQKKVLDAYRERVDAFEKSFNVSL